MTTPASAAMWSGQLPTDVQAAAQALARGELVAFATETVYGLGADADQPHAVAHIFATKGRPADHPLIVHIAKPDGAKHYATQAPNYAKALMTAFWPGPLTLILPRRPDVASAAAGGHASIGLRCPAHPVAQALLQAALDADVRGVAAPSANRFGRVSPTTAQHVVDEFGHSVHILDGGACDVGIESTIVDCTGDAPVLLRPGMITAAQIEAVCAVPLAAPHAKSARASGTLDSHYAPRAKVVLKPLADMLPAAGRALYFLPIQADVAAHDLFATLRKLDTPQVQEIWVQTPPEGQDWDGVRDRLTRAAFE